MPDDDVPSPIDFHDPVQARAWVEDTVKRRPYRPRFFAAFAEEGTDKNPALMATREEQLEALAQAGLLRIRLLLDDGGMALYCATREAD
jgi:hypothetical protein